MGIFITRKFQTLSGYWMEIEVDAKEGAASLEASIGEAVYVDANEIDDLISALESAKQDLLKARKEVNNEKNIRRLLWQ